MKIAHKTKIIIMLILMTFITQAGLVLYTPAFVQISHALNISSASVKTTLTAYLLGFGLSQLCYGPLSDRIGRKKPLLAGMIIFSLGCIWSILSNSYITLFLSRLVQGIGAGAGMTLSRSILRDSFEGKAYIKAASYLSSGFAIGLGLTPVLGGHIIEYFSWRYEFVALLILGIALFLCFALFLPETRPAKTVAGSLSNTFAIFIDVIKSWRFLSFLIGGVMAYGIVIAYTTMAPFLFQKTLGLSATSYGQITLLIAVAYYLGTWINRLLVNKITTASIIKIGLLLIFISGLLMLMSKLMFNLFNLYVTFIPLFIATLGQALIWSNCVAGALKDLSQVAGTAAALFSCLQMLLSAGVSAIAAIPHENNQIPLSMMIIGLSIIAWLALSKNIAKEAGNQ